MTNAEGRPGFICIHVAEQGIPVCLVEHSSPINERDSGWGFYCGADSHEDAELRITDLNRFRNLDPDLPHLLATVPEEASPGAARRRCHGLWSRGWRIGGVTNKNSRTNLQSPTTSLSSPHHRTARTSEVLHDYACPALDATESPSTVRISPWSSVMVGFHLSLSMARRMSGRRLTGSSIGSGA